MFDIGFTELLVVAVIALLVLGPERLPVAARMAGLWIGRIKRNFLSLKHEVEREIGADEIRQQLHNERILELEQEMRATLNGEPSASPAKGTGNDTTPAPANPPADPAASSAPDSPKTP